MCHFSLLDLLHETTRIPARERGRERRQVQRSAYQLLLLFWHLPFPRPQTVSTTLFIYFPLSFTRTLWLCFCPFLFCSLHDNTNCLLPNLEQNPQPPPLVKVNKPDGINPALTGKMKCILFQVTDSEKKNRRRDDWRY